MKFSSISTGLNNTIPIVAQAAAALTMPGGTGSAISKVAESVGKGARGAVGRVIDNHAVMAQRLDNAGSAITRVSQQTMILSRSFVDEAIIDEPILPPRFSLLCISRR